MNRIKRSLLSRHATLVSDPISELRAHRARLFDEIQSSEAKAQRLRDALAQRKTNLSKLDAKLALTGDNACSRRQHE